MSEVLNVGGGANPVGTIISFFGPSAPDGYLVCDGTTYNRADYPELADHLVSNFSDLVGDGSTTFKVPDLRGEFLRGTGTNSHENQGSGGDVGVHQDATQVPQAFGNASAKLVAVVSYSDDACIKNSDYSINNKKGIRVSSGTQTSNTYSALNSVRPTNTSILYCIKY